MSATAAGLTKKSSGCPGNLSRVSGPPTTPSMMISDTCTPFGQR